MRAPSSGYEQLSEKYNEGGSLGAEVKNSDNRGHSESL